MILFLNGRLMPESKAALSVHDRGFLYGDGLFETIPVYGGVPFRWAQHLARFTAGAQQLRIRLPIAESTLRAAAAELIRRNRRLDAILRLALSRGVGPRGYSMRGADSPTLVMTLHPPVLVDRRRPRPWRLVTSTFRLPAGDPLAMVKSSNKLVQICARTEAEMRGADEAVLLNTRGEVTEAAGANLFWLEETTVRTSVGTTPLKAGVLPGVTRGVVCELCTALGWSWRERRIRPKALLAASGVFATLSTRGIVEVVSLDGQRLLRSRRVRTLQQAYWRLLDAETQAPGAG